MSEFDNMNQNIGAEGSFLDQAGESVEKATETVADGLNEVTDAVAETVADILPEAAPEAPKAPSFHEAV